MKHKLVFQAVGAASIVAINFDKIEAITLREDQVKNDWMILISTAEARVYGIPFGKEHDEKTKANYLFERLVLLTEKDFEEKGYVWANGFIGEPDPFKS